MQSTIPFHVYPACGMNTPAPPPMTTGAGIYFVPGAFEDGSRVAFAYDDAGVIVSSALVEPGGDFSRMRWDLHQAVQVAARRP